MKTLVFSALASLGLACPALADDITLSAPGAAYGMHTTTVDMVAYRTDLGDGTDEVTAYFRARTAWDQPSRVMMRLEDQDSVSFSMPSDPTTLYTFSRTAGTVTVSAENVPLESALY